MHLRKTDWLRSKGVTYHYW